MGATVDVSQLITTGEAARILGVTTLMARVYAEEGKVRAVSTRLGWLLDRTDVERFAVERAEKKAVRERIAAIITAK